MHILQSQKFHFKKRLLGMCLCKCGKDVRRQPLVNGIKLKTASDPRGPGSERKGSLVSSLNIEAAVSNGQSCETGWAGGCPSQRGSLECGRGEEARETPACAREALRRVDRRRAEPAAFCRASGRLRGPCRKPLGGSRSGRALSPWALCAVTNLFLVCYVYCFISENSSDRKRVMTEGRR